MRRLVDFIATPHVDEWVGIDQVIGYVWNQPLPSGIMILGGGISTILLVGAKIVAQRNISR